MRYPVDKPVVILVGPTAVGKSTLALELAVDLNAEIISADSRYFYRGMDIGTAKPTTEELQSVRHHLVDVAEPDETWSLALFQRRARAIIADLHENDRLPLVVGGTGQYVRALTEGWQIPEQKPDMRMREVIEEWADEIGAQKLHEVLVRLDPQAAQAIDWRNQRRTVRALEVIFKTGKLFSKQRSKAPLPYQVKLVGMQRERPELYARVDARIETMLADGFEQEVRKLMDKGYGSETPAMSAIGYREMRAYIRAEISLEEAVMLIKRRTRQFVRRQANWFKPDDARIKWFNMKTLKREEVITYILSAEGWLDE